MILSCDPQWLSFLIDALKRDKSVGLASSLLFDIGWDRIQGGELLMVTV